jgi:hypothetical protein
MHAANEKTRMKCINFSIMAPTTMTFNATNEMVACMRLSKARPYKKGRACDPERPNKPGRREYDCIYLSTYIGKDMMIAWY